MSSSSNTGNMVEHKWRDDLYNKWGLGSRASGATKKKRIITKGKGIFSQGVSSLVRNLIILLNHSFYLSLQVLMVPKFSWFLPPKYFSTVSYPSVGHHDGSLRPLSPSSKLLSHIHSETVCSPTGEWFLQNKIRWWCYTWSDYLWCCIVLGNTDKLLNLAWMALYSLPHESSLTSLPTSFPSHPSLHGHCF